MNVQLAAIESYPYHRTDEFYKIFANCGKALAKFIDAPTSPLILSSSGTGAMEAAITNLTKPGDSILTLNGGKFGQRWGEIGNVYECDVHELSFPWGQEPDTAKICETLQNNPRIKAIFLQANETSSGAAYPVEDIAKAVRSVRPEILIIVDAISAFGAEEVRMQDWDLDAVVMGSQKGPGIPPGLSFISLSARAWGSISKRPKFYFDLEKERHQQEKGMSAFTPAISLVVQLSLALKNMQETGWQNILRHHQIAADAVRSAMQALGLKLLAAKRPSNALTAVILPDTVDGKALVKNLRELHQMTVAGGQGHMAGKLLRFAHLGAFDPGDIAAGLLALEQELIRQNHSITRGTGAGTFWHHYHSQSL